MRRPNAMRRGEVGVNASLLDQAQTTRAEDRFDIAAVDAWLKQALDGLQGQPQVTQFARGASNLTYCLQYDNRALILRRPPVGTKAASAHNMAREYRIQKALAPVFPKVPAMLALCSDASILGAEFYVMAKVDGIILRRDWPPQLGMNRLAVRALCERAIDTLIALHQVNVMTSGLQGLAKGEGYNRRQIDGWSERFRRARTWNVSKRGAEQVMAWLDQHCPEEVGLCMIHGDYRFDNLVLSPEDPQQIVAVLDWELATIGDPLMDLGNTLAYWVQADDDRFFRQFRRQPTHTDGMMSRAEVVAYYAEKTGQAVDHWVFYEVYGLFRLAVIVQQIYYRYHHKQTRNPQFKYFWWAANTLIWRCQKLIRTAS